MVRYGPSPCLCCLLSPVSCLLDPAAACPASSRTSRASSLKAPGASPPAALYSTIIILLPLPSLFAVFPPPFPFLPFFSFSFLLLIYSIIIILFFQYFRPFFSSSSSSSSSSSPSWWSTRKRKRKRKRKWSKAIYLSKGKGKWSKAIYRRGRGSDSLNDVYKPSNKAPLTPSEHKRQDLTG